MKVAVVVDSTSYLSEEILAEHNIFTIPLNVVVGDKTFKENEIDNKWYYAEMAALEELPTTSQPSIGDYILLLESLYREGYTDVISFSSVCWNQRHMPECTGSGCKCRRY
jgi:Uncharacterized protein conserved in bacteria